MNIQQIQNYMPWVFPVREHRYLGTDLSWSVANLAPIDRDAILTFYDKIGSLMGLHIWHLDDLHQKRQLLSKWAHDEDWRQCWRNVAALGPESYSLQGAHKLLRQVMHDLRGGPMTSLVMSMSMLLNGRDVDLEYIRLLARDVRKITRNCFPDLDPERYNLDCDENPHSVRLIGEKWSRLSRQGGVNVYLEFKGNIANSCVEFSALDRTLYNLMNNAIRESLSDDHEIELFVVTKPDTEEIEDLRFWIRNRISSDQSLGLRTRFGDNLSDLFLTSFSTTGSGMGMQIVGEFVGKAYGVSAKRALEMNLAGIHLEEEYFNVWFHWPTVD